MLNKLISQWAEGYMKKREPNVIIGGDRNPPYIRRWWVIPRNKFFNIYLHEVGQDDDDRALHDHPWYNMSYVVSGGYNEITPKGTFPLLAGQIRFRKPTAAHRLALINAQRTVTIFITGPRLREWGFHCPKGWVFWKDFVSVSEGGHVSNVGKGCGED